jgi:quercetin dioxygenase-like cupin family protein
MKKKHVSDVKPIEVNKDGFRGMSARYLWTKDDGCENYALRLMEFEPGGHTSFHSHAEEHEFYFLEGEPAYVDADGKQTLLVPGDTIYTAPNETHQIKNVGSTTMKMICTIPILPGGDGKLLAPRKVDCDACFAGENKQQGC